MAHIFISYSKQNIDFAQHLRRLLQDQGFSVWMDETQLGASEKWWSSIESNIKTASAFIVILSPEARESDWVEREILVAEDKRHRKPIFPVLLAGEQWSRLANIQYEDMRAGVKAELTPGFVRRLEAAAPRGASGETPPPLPGNPLPHTAPHKGGFLANPKWQGIGVLVSIVGVIIAIIAIVPNLLQPSAAPTPTVALTSISASETPAPTSTTSPTETILPTETLFPTATDLPSATPTQFIDLNATAIAAQQATIDTLNFQIQGSATAVSQVTAPLVTEPTIPTQGYPCSATIVSNNATVLNVVRAEPSLSARLRDPVQVGEQITIYEKRGESSTNTWYRVSENTYYSAWIPTQYLSLSTSCPS